MVNDKHTLWKFDEKSDENMPLTVKKLCKYSKPSLAL